MSKNIGKDWNKDTTVAIGNSFEMNGKEYTVYPGQSCGGCAFHNSEECYITPECREAYRGDETAVYYVEQKDGVESHVPETKEVKTRQNMKRNFEITEQETKVKNIFNKEDEAMIEHLIRKMLGLGEDIELDDNLKETPHRVLKLWTEMTEGYREDPADHLNKVFPVNSPNLADDDTEETQFKDDSIGKEYRSGIVVVSTSAWSSCVHHCAPMHCRVDVAYIPRDKVVGLSKIVRMVKGYGKRLNLQEGWQDNIANAMMNKLDALGVAVRISGVHSCVSMRGASEQTSKTTTSCVRGCFATEPEAREEAFKLMDQNKLGDLW